MGMITNNLSMRVGKSKRGEMQCRLEKMRKREIEIVYVKEAGPNQM